MKTFAHIIILLALLQSHALSTEKEQAGSEQFKVTYVEDKVLPPLTVISKDFDAREEMLEFERKLIAAGTKEDELEIYRRDILRSLYFPMKITDAQTGNSYEVQKDRRTIIAKDKAGNMLWTVNPFVDTKLKPYRYKHPIIEYLGPPFLPVKSEISQHTLQLTFNSSQFGGLNTTNGEFTIWGQD